MTPHRNLKARHKTRRILLTPALITLTVGLAACGGGGGGSGDNSTNGGGGGGSGDNSTNSLDATVTYEAIKTFRFDWNSIDDADYYKLMENPDGVSGFTQVGSNIPTGTTTKRIVVPLHKRDNAEYIVSSCDSEGCSDSDTITIDGNLVESVGYIKAENAESGDYFGGSEGLLGGFDSLSYGVVKLSEDGRTLAVSAYQEDSNGSSADDNSLNESGAVYIFVKDGSNWVQQAYLKADNADAEDHFGGSISLSNDGDTIAIGAPWEDSGSQSINPGSAGRSDNSQSDAGAVYVYIRDQNNNWTEQAYIKAGDLNDFDEFGTDVTLDNSGDRLVAAATGKGNFGFVYTFNRDSQGNWSEDASSLTPPGPGGDRFGQSLSISGDGETLAVGQETPQNTISDFGKVHIYTRDSGAWTNQVGIRSSNSDSNDNFAADVSLSDDGRTLAASAYGEASNGIGINSGAKANNDSDDSGAVYVYTSSDGQNWTEEAYIKASNTDGADRFGISLDLSASGNQLVVGARRESSVGKGVNPGDQNTNGTTGSGAVYYFEKASGAWSQTGFFKASNPNGFDQFGFSVSLSSDTNTLAVGANKEDGGGTGVSSDMQDDNSATSSGAVYLF